MAGAEETEIVFVSGETLRVDGLPDAVAGKLRQEGPGGMDELISDGEQVIVNRAAVAYLRSAPTHVPMVT